jgi:DNA-binding response OmpR family regulator
MKILLVEDNEPIARMIERGLNSDGYDIVVTNNGKSALDIASRSNFSLIVLDIMLPELSGIEVCERLRDRGNRVPILMLTARDTVEDRVRGLDVGADDYLNKPFAFPELSARVRALLRRDKIHRTKIIKIADLTIDTGQHLVTRGGTEIGLSHREYELLEALAAHESQVLTREVILERVWMNDDTYSNTVDVYINMLRKKIDAGQNVKLIHTVRGTGYTLRVLAEPTK